MNKDKKFFVTTPIYYINDVPHIGHAYATIAADILVRYHSQLGEKTFLLTGSDENSQKTIEAANKKSLSVEKYSDEMVALWQETWKKLSIADGKFGFVRTTDKNHEQFVREVFQKIYDAGFIEKGIYKGLYCIGHEAFIKEEDLDENGLCPDHKKKPEILEEKNYFFKLKSLEQWLLGYYSDHPNFIEPTQRKHEADSFVTRGLEDISISRENAKWGIKVPFDESQRIYVWFDALLSYYSGSPKNFWPANLHIIGKDILRFHAVIWPAMLKAAGMEEYIPEKIFAHGFFTIDGQKISKSLGNVIDPIKIVEEYGIDALRYFLFKEIPFGNDGDFSFERLEEVYNSDLANGLGNLVARVAKLAEKSELEFEIQNIDLSSLDQPDRQVLALLDELEFQRVLEYIWGKYRNLDQYLEERKPWEIKDSEKLRPILTSAISEIIKTNTLLKPFLPTTAEKIEKQFLQNKISYSAGLFPRK